MKQKSIEVIREALGEASVLFMSQECKGTEIVMPTEELSRIADETNRRILQTLRKEVEGKNTREMNPGENRSKYLAFQRGENHMKAKLLTLLTTLEEEVIK